MKETTEQDIKGYEVELAMNEASIQTLEVCFSLIQHFDAVVYLLFVLEDIAITVECLRAHI